MLEEMRIRGLGVIDDAVLELSPGLNVVTGETGAGKTMVVQGLSLLFGGRADAGRVRPGADRALVEGRLVLPPASAAVARALDAGADLDDGALLVSRTVGADGRSRAHLGGRSVPVGVLGELSGDVLALHGQSDQQGLLRPAAQRTALDRFAGEAVSALRRDYAERWGRWREVRALLERLRADAAERTREAELLRLGLAEVEAAAPQPGESAALAAEIERLAHADDLRAAAEGAQRALTGDESDPEAVDALALVTAARRALEPAAAHDPALGELATRLAEAGHLLADAAGDLASYAAGVDADPVRLEAAQERLAVLTALVRRHAVDDVDRVLAWSQGASARLLELDGDDDRVGALADEAAALEAELGALAGRLSAARSEAAERFGAAVGAELAELAMPHARVTAQVVQREAADGLPVGERRLAAGPDGVDEVELLLAPHPGAPPRPLHRGASGGELSRVMLAVEVVFAGSDPVPLMVFDEVDAGVGGTAAVEVGRRLARLARDHQVVVVTHLPQVAAFADRHLTVVKGSADGVVTRSGVVALDDAGRVVELSRMLAGHDSGLARGHAEELLAAAGEAKGR
ncbi:MAG TPA: DNA repair protein RecN [Mycobacteriales bacterium]|nr:DNA repair protein RecN [Mycobacteriales bacterium]